MQIDLLDVFVGAAPLSGNPLAVVRGGDALSTGQMLALTRWIGFSETTFLLPPTDTAADYQLRIFYPAGEMVFAGHPTLGSAFAWLAAGGRPENSGRVVQQCGIGLVPVRIEAADRLAFRAPPMRNTAALTHKERTEVIQCTGADPASVIEAVYADNGMPWKLLRMTSAASVLAAQPTARSPRPHTDLALIGPHPAGSDVDWEVRAFFTAPTRELVEDPITGMLNAGAACHLFANGLAHGSYTAAQGQLLGRGGGRIYASQEDDGIWIGGRVAMVSCGGALSAFETANR